MEGIIFRSKISRRRKRWIVLRLATVYSQAVGLGGIPFVSHSSAAVRKVSLAMSSAVSICSRPKRLLITATILANSCWKSSFNDSTGILVAKERPDFDAAALVENRATMRQGRCIVEIFRLNDNKAAQHFADLDEGAVGDNAAGLQHFAGHIMPLAACGHAALCGDATRPVLPFLGDGLEFLRRDVAGIA